MVSMIFDCSLMMWSRVSVLLLISIVEFLKYSRISLICRAESDERTASFRTSSATTPNPFP